MKFKSLGYCFVQGLKNIGRNRIFSLASVATMTLCIFVFGLFYSITANVSYMVDELSDTLCVEVFFEKGTSDQRVESIGASIKEIKGVTKIEFTSAEEAWEKYKEKYFGDEYKDLAEGFADDNPLQDSASYQVYVTDSEIQQKVVSAIEKIDGVRKVNSSEVTADSLTEISKLVSIFSLAVLVLLLGVTLFLISNTISIGITVRSEEIKIMRLLGAHNAFIRAPFIVEGMVIGAVGAFIPIIILYFAYGNLVSYIIGKFSFLATILSFMSVGQLFKVFVPIALVMGIGLGLLGSILSVGKRLKI